MSGADYDLQELRKDEALDQLAGRINVARFVAYAPLPEGPEQTFCRLRGHRPNAAFSSLRAVATASGHFYCMVCTISNCIFRCC